MFTHLVREALSIVAERIPLEVAVLLDWPRLLTVSRESKSCMLLVLRHDGAFLLGEKWYSMFGYLVIKAVLYSPGRAVRMKLESARDIRALLCRHIRPKNRSVSGTRISLSCLSLDNDLFHRQAKLAQSRSSECTTKKHQDIQARHVPSCLAWPRNLIQIHCMSY